MISRQCVSSGRHQDYGIFGPVQDSFRSSRPQQLIAGEVVSLKTLAADDVLDPTEIRRLLPPLVSVPTIVEAILAGNQPANLTVEA